jgi:hypothetical protein
MIELKKWAYDDIVNEDKAANDEALSNFNSIDTCVNVDCISTEHRYQAHVNQIDEA